MTNDWTLDPNLDRSFAFDTAFHALERGIVARQQKVLADYNAFCSRFMRQSNVSQWLGKRGRTPEIVLLHGDHNISMSISFYIPDPAEQVLLAWDLKAYRAREWEPDPSMQLVPGQTFFRTIKALRSSHGPMGGSTGGAWFNSTSDPIETRQDVYWRERERGAAPEEAARIATETAVPAHRYAPSAVEITCWCGMPQRVIGWPLVLTNIERTTRPGHTRIENKRIVTTLPSF